MRMGIIASPRKAKRAGLGRWVRELAHDAESGAPRLKFHDDRMAIYELSRKALETLAKIRGLFRETPPPPPAPDFTQEEALRLMPLDVLRAWSEAYKQAEQKKLAITAEAKEAGQIPR